MQFTYYGHATFCIETAGKKLLFDPFFTGNPLAKDIDIMAIQADYIFVSHGHGDHVADLVAIAKNTGALIIAMHEITQWALQQGCKNVHPLNLGGAKQFDFGKVKMVPALHSSVLPDGTYGGNPAGFVVSTAEGNFYYAGDTALTMDMQLIPKYAPIDFAILPIGDNFTMGYEDACTAAQFVATQKVIGVHYDTFGYITIDHNNAMDHFAANNLALILPPLHTNFSIH